MNSWSWEPSILGDLIAVKHGWPLKSEHFSEKLSGRPIVVAVGNFRYKGGFRFDETTTKEYRAEYPQDYELSPNDILLIMTCQTQGGEILGIPGRIPDDGRTYLHNQRLGKVEIKSPELIDSGFLYQLFRSRPFNSELCATASGSKILHTAPSRIEAFEFARPPLDEQRAISAVLGALDDKIEQNRRTAQVLERLARAIFKAWFVDFEPVKAKAEGAASFPSVPQEVFEALPKGFVESEIGLVPEGWEVKALGDVCDVNARSVRKGEIEGEIEYVNISSVTRGHLDEIERMDYADAPSRARRLIQDGDTIWSCVRPNRMSYLYIHQSPPNRIVSTGFAVLTPTKIGPSFLYQLTTRPEFVEYLAANATGSAYPAVRSDHFESAKFCCPPPFILDAFDQMTHPMRGWIGAAEVESRQLAELRDYLLPKLLSGEVRVEVIDG